MPTPSLTLAEETQAGDRLTVPKPQWITYDGQELAEGDYLWHKTYGQCQVTIATRTGTLKAETDDGATLDLTYGKNHITYVWK